MMIQRYIFPETIEACLKELKNWSGKARIIAGGTDLLLAIQRRELAPVALLDISRIAELEGIREEHGEVRLGARVTHAACASSDLIRKSATCLAEACVTVGSPQIQNVATLAGNVINAQPAADGAVALIALGAKAKIASPDGEREEQVEELYRGVGKSRVDSSRELLTSFRFPSPKAGEATAFLRVAPRGGMGLPVVNGAVWISLREETIEEIRIALGPVSDRPARPRRAETVLKGASWNDTKALREAARVASEEANPRDSLLRGSAEYRRESVKMLVEQLLKRVIGRARESR